MSWVKTVIRKGKLVVPAAALSLLLYLPFAPMGSRGAREAGKPLSGARSVSVGKIHKLPWDEFEKGAEKIVDAGGVRFSFKPASYCASCHDLNALSVKEREHVLKAVEGVKSILGERVKPEMILFLPVSTSFFDKSVASFMYSEARIEVKLPPLFEEQTPQATFSSYVAHELTHQATFSVLWDSHEIWSGLLEFLFQPTEENKLNQYTTGLMRRLAGATESDYEKEKQFTEEFVKNIDEAGRVSVEAFLKFFRQRYELYEKRVTPERLEEAKRLLKESFAEYKRNPILLDALALRLNNHAFTPFDVMLGKTIPKKKVRELQKYVNYFVNHFDELYASARISGRSYLPFNSDVNDPFFCEDVEPVLTADLMKLGLNYEDAVTVYYRGLWTMYNKLQNKTSADAYAKTHSKELDILLTIKRWKAKEITSLLEKELKTAPPSAKNVLRERYNKMNAELKQLENAHRRLKKGLAPWR